MTVHFGGSSRPLKSPRKSRSRGTRSTFHVLASGLERLEDRHLLSVEPSGSPTVLAGFSEVTSTALLGASGDYVVVGTSNTPGDYDILMQRFASDGTLIGGPTLVNEVNNNDQIRASVASDASGNFVVTWESWAEAYPGGPSSTDIFARRFAADGTALGAEFRVNSFLTHNQWSADIGVDADGDFVIAWWRQPHPSGGSGWQVYAQRYDATGTAQGGEFRVDDTLEASGYFVAPDLEVNFAPDGSFGIAYSTKPNTTDDVALHRYSPSGDSFGPSSILEIGNGAFLSVAPDLLGGWFVIRGNRLQRRDASGILIANTDFVANPLNGAAFSASVSPSGKYVVAWIQGSKVSARRYNADNVAYGRVFTVYDAMGPLSAKPVISIPMTGDFLISWSSGAGAGYQRYVSAANLPPVVTITGPDSVLEKDSIDFTISVVDPNFNEDHLTFAYSWDLDGDGEFDDSNLGPPYRLTLGPSDRNLLGINDNGIHAIGVRAMDLGGAQSTPYYKQLTIVNSPPTPPYLGQVQAGWAIVGQPTPFNFYADDYSSIDSNSPFTFMVDWNNDGIFDQTVIGPSGIAVHHVFDSVGPKSIGLKAIDKDGGESVVSDWPVTVSATSGQLALNPDALNMNEESEANGEAPSLTRLGDEGYLLVWTDIGDHSIKSVKGLRIDTAGNPIGAPFDVSSDATMDNFDPSVAADSDGDFVVVWSRAMDGVSNPTRVYARRFSSDGSPIGGEFYVSNNTTGYARYSSVAMNAVGAFVIVWAASSTEPTGNGIRAQRYDADGNALGSHFRVDTTIFTGSPSVAIDANGEFVIAYAQNNAVFTRTFAADGSTLAGPFVVTSFGGQPALAFDSAGQFLIVWQNSPTFASDIVAQRYDLSGLPLSQSFEITAATNGERARPAVVFNSDGKFLVTWEAVEYSASFFQRRTVGRFFGEASVEVELLIDAWDSAESGYGSAIAAGPSGEFVVAWERKYSDPQPISSVFVQRLAPIVGTAPTADAGGPYVYTQSDVGISLDGSGSTDPDVGQTLTYAWDLDGDGVYGDAVGATVSLTWSELAPFGITDAPGSHIVRLRVSDSGGGSTTSAAFVSIENAAPSLTIEGDTSIIQGFEHVFTFTATDPSAADQAAGGTYEIDWDGDEVADEIVDAPFDRPLNLTHFYNDVGSYVLKARAIDQHGAVGAWASLALQVDEFGYETFDGATHLVWGGTQEADTVLFLGVGGGQVLIWHLDTNAYAYATGVTGKLFALGHGGDDTLIASNLPGDAEIYGEGGNDVLAWAGGDHRVAQLFGGDDNDQLYLLGGESVTARFEGDAGDDVILNLSPEPSNVAWFIGGEGNDGLAGGPGADILDGGAGDDMLIGAFDPSGPDAGDTLTGGEGADLLVGGLGADSLDGGIGDDLMLAGPLVFLVPELGEAYLSVSMEWRSSRAYAERVANLTGVGVGPRENGDNFLVAGDTALNDAQVDTLLGGADDDFYFAEIGVDLTSDLAVGEEFRDLGV